MAFPVDPTLVSKEISPLIRSIPWSETFRSDQPLLDHPPYTSVYELLTTSATSHPASPCLGWRLPNAAYIWWSYDIVSRRADALGRALMALGLSKGDRIGMYARNCPQWTLLQYASLSQGLVVVPIYDTLGPNVVEYVCNHAEVKIVCVSPDNYPKLAQVRDKGKCPTVEHVLLIGTADISRDGPAGNVEAETVLRIPDFLEKGEKLVADGLHPPPDVALTDTMAIMYTSGTTGDPKGVVLSHRAILASVSSAYRFFEKWGQQFNENDVFLSYLPLSHIFEQQAEALLIGLGGRIGFYQGDIKLLLSDMEELKPTVFAGVPRVFARFQQRIQENVDAASFIQKTLFNWAYNRQVRAEENPGQVGRSAIWDALVFKKVRAKLLPNCRLVITGSAPMSSQTNDFLKVCLQCPVVQGYGLTETVGGMICSIPDKSKSGTCGGPLPGVQVKLRDLPDMGYLNTDKPYPRGEICVKGDIVFEEYYKNDTETKKAFDADGFFCTGDVAQWKDDGSLQIIDRAKNLFKLSQGEYVSPEALEGEYAKAKLVGQIFVYGNSLQSTLLAVVVPDVPQSMAWGEKHGLSTLESIAAAPGYKKELIAQLEEMRVKSHFKKYEAIRDMIIEIKDLNELGQGFTVQNNLMTPSFKLKRPQLKAKYSADLEGLYDNM